jgi:dTDP-glucose 4,6-dehydratase
MNKKNIIVTGGLGFIGSNLIRKLCLRSNFNVINIDKITYASDQSTLMDLKKNYIHLKVDICDKRKLSNILEKYKPKYIFHLAAETHVDKSIDSPANFISTNIVGTFNLLNSSLKYWKNLTAKHKSKFKFIHISTDEVYGDLGYSIKKFDENFQYRPNSPYSASKASSDHFVRAWFKTYRLPTIITTCSNNFGPYQFPEKLIPLTIMSALKGEKIRVYGDGKQIRDWIHVFDHVDALIKVMKKGQAGETYNIGSGKSINNLKLVKDICNLLNNMVKDKPKGIKDFNTLISFVEDRPGHDIKYLVNAKKIKKKLKWRQKISLNNGLHKTIKWYLNNIGWINKVKRKSKYSFKRYGLLK